MRMLILAAAISLTHCQPVIAFSNKPPKVEEPPPKRGPIPNPVKPPEVIDAYAGRELIFKIATESECAKEKHSDKGKPNSGYMKGIALTYVKTICSPEGDVYKIASQPIGAATEDALAHYGLKLSSASARLNNVFALIIGSNARESNWRWCVGRDTVAKESDKKECISGTGKTCEAGLTQTSYNSVPKSGPMRELFEAYLEYPIGCFAPQYKGNITCKAEDMKSYGTDPKARAYQTLSKECPGYSIESGVAMFRTKMTHYGPLKRKTALLKPACISMFEKLGKEVEKDPNLCYVL